MKKSPSSSVSKFSRRQFITLAGAAAVAPMIVPSSVFGQGGKSAPSDRISMGVVGWGWQGPSDAKAFMALKDCQVVGICDLDKQHLDGGIAEVNAFYGTSDCKGYHDYKELCARPDIDVILMAVPDHWHALVSIEAARNKKDIYGEKPLARTIGEQQALVKAVQKNNRIYQMGSWQRSERNFRKAAEIVRNGLIGKVTHVEVGLPGGHTDFAGTHDQMAATTPPDYLDYETWIGPSKMQPYIPARLHKNWRWNYNTGGGQLLDWIGHHCDIAHWGLGFDLEGPSEIEGHGDFPDKDAVWNTCTKYRIELKYPKDITMTIASAGGDLRMGCKWIGTDGWVWVDRGGFDASNQEWRDMRELSDDVAKIRLYKSDNHYRNFLDCVKSRQSTICPVEVGHHSAIPGHLGLISMLVGRKIKWNNKTERLVGDDQDALSLLTRPYRDPWKWSELA
jgi:predicted dehydrogenase